ncbi:hypothetical protein OBP_086 [Pseudomonas phage OBP]|uniref:hypothetical protein n=1 Tax=Pseudomonas phage OBP TaxID=1124849 RepID=UPI000240D434|nr:hypothetical protein OBP_086 [Pseudomonas phage OBP]AEV89523.1 hypothetical protein OBP_086 [Pseudomonas phage OBP]
METLEVVSFTLPNPRIVQAIHTKPIVLHEIVVFVLGKQLILGPTEKYSFDNRMLEYMVSCLDPLDKTSVVNGDDNVTLIYLELIDIIEKIQQGYVYQSLLNGGEVYLKYDYDIGRRFSKIRLYTDTYEYGDPVL